MLGHLYELRQEELVSVSPENLTGEKGNGGATPLEMGSSRNAARELGTGWKVNPNMIIPAGETLTVLAELKTWYQVQDPETGWVGFIRADLLQK